MSGTVWPALLAQHGLKEIDRLSSFPMEMFLIMGRAYVGHPEVGAECQELRMEFEKRLVASGHSDVLRRMYRSLAQASLGRTCGILAQKGDGEPIGCTVRSGVSSA